MYFPSPANIRLTGLFAFIYLLFQLTVGIFTECDMPKIKPLCSQRLRHRRHGRLLLLHFPYPGLHLLHLLGNGLIMQQALSQAVKEQKKTPI